MSYIIRVSIDIPNGAEYYSGNLLDPPTCTYFKHTMIAGYEHWWYYDPSSKRKEWLLFGHNKPSYCDPVSEIQNKIYRISDVKGE